jgi:hypothetical protein
MNSGRIRSGSEEEKKENGPDGKYPYEAWYDV